MPVTDHQMEPMEGAQHTPFGRPRQDVRKIISMQATRDCYPLAHVQDTLCTGVRHFHAAGQLAGHILTLGAIHLKTI